MEVAPQKYDRIYLMIAIFALVLAGDLLWLSSRSITEESEYQAAAIFRKRTEEQEADRISRDSEKAFMEFESELNELEAEVAGE